MMNVKIELTKDEALEILTIMQNAKEGYEEAINDTDYTIQLIAKEWLDNINRIIKKTDKAIEIYYQRKYH